MKLDPSTRIRHAWGLNFTVTLDMNIGDSLKVNDPTVLRKKVQITQLKCALKPMEKELQFIKCSSSPHRITELEITNSVNFLGVSLVAALDWREQRDKIGGQLAKNVSVL